MSNCFNMQCPECGDSDQIDIQATVWLRLTTDGTDADLSEDGTHEWSDASPAHCAACGHTATIADFDPENQNDSTDDTPAVPPSIFIPGTLYVPPPTQRK